MAIFSKPPMFFISLWEQSQFLATNRWYFSCEPMEPITEYFEGVFMGIDIRAERLIDLDEAAKLFPGRDGGTIHPLTVGLYARRGKKGIRLETVLAGPRRCTSIEAVARFIEAVTAAAAGNRPAQGHRRTHAPAKKQRCPRRGRRVEGGRRLRNGKAPGR